ncbi:hypothetical protein [Fibrella forsythiae]|uniref:Sialate O-acetylesterase domain-containing protein n=1 Tax=Fibrella forsythiae TaxID=2817061 RepID=A0ABS3JMH3_9BACT|nr:hypothetical protein [Fibrella forsythiae]MBO0951215.1 hypothetical protein [Fibrella forsythiae]
MLQLTSPLPNQVYQRNAQGRAYVSIKGTCPTDVVSLEVICTPGIAGRLQTATIPVINGAFTAVTILEQGDYTMVVSPVKASGKDTAAAITQKVGIGEVFVVWGHSVAQGDDRFHLGGATDPRVFTVGIDMTANGANAHYNTTGDAADLPSAIVPYASDVVPGPYGSSTHFWAKFAEKITLKYNVPTMLLNAAFGGTNLEQWYKSITKTPFEHGFVDYRLGFPYINLKNAFTKYTSVSGFRAMLVDHGANDWQNTDYEAIFGYFKGIIEQARIDSKSPKAAVVVNRATPFGKTGIRGVQQRVISDVAYCFAGPDYDAQILEEADFIDSGHIHLSVQGQAKAAQAWADAIPPTVLAKMVPYQAKAVELITAPVETQKTDDTPLTISRFSKFKLAAISIDRNLLLGAVLAAVLILGSFLLGRWSIRHRNA